MENEYDNNEIKIGSNISDDKQDIALRMKLINQMLNSNQLSQVMDRDVLVLEKGKYIDEKSGHHKQKSGQAISSNAEQDPNLIGVKDSKTQNFCLEEDSMRHKPLDQRVIGAKGKEDISDRGTSGSSLSINWQPEGENIKKELLYIKEDLRKIAQRIENLLCSIFED